MQTFHHYILHEELGRGSNSVVYAAEHRQTQQKVALKLYPPDFAEDQAKMDLFEQRVATLNSLNHAAVVPVYDSGVVSQLPYLALPLMEGGSLRDRLDRLQGGSLPIDEVQSILSRVAPALEALHQNGIVHTDLTPDSIVFDELGLAYVGGLEVIDADDVGALTLLRENNLNPHYLAPEQVQRLPVSAQTDIYALSAVLYEMLSGRPPYSGGTPLSIAYQHVNDPIPEIETRGLAPAYVAGLNRLLARGMAKEARERPSSAQQFLEQFTEIVGDSAFKHVALNPAPVAVNAPLIGIDPAVSDAEPAETEPEPAEPEPEAAEPEDPSFQAEDMESNYFDPEGGTGPNSRYIVAGMFGLTVLCMVGILGTSFAAYLIRGNPADNPVAFPTLAPSTQGSDGGPAPETVAGVDVVESAEPTPWDELVSVRGGPVDGLFPDLGENPFTADEAGWHIYANANAVREAVYVDGVIYAASSNGVVIFDTIADTQTHLTVFDGLPSSDTRDVVVCDVPERRIVIGTSSGTALIDPAEPRVIADVWIFDENDLARNDIRSLACSPEGAKPILYLGHDYSGVSIFDVEAGSWERITEADGLADNEADDLAASADMLWIGHDIYLSSYDLTTGVGTELDPDTSDLPTDWPDAMDVAADGTMWMITLDGLVRGDAAGNWTLYSDEVNAYNLPIAVGTALTVDPDGFVWVGYSGGRICRFDPAAERCSDPYSLLGSTGSDKEITSIDTTADGLILVGTGLNGVRLGQIDAIGEWTPFELEGQLPYNGMTALAESGEFMWIGTERGLYRAPLRDLSGGNWAGYSGNDTPLPRTWINRLLADGVGGVWVGTPNGLAHVTADYRVLTYLTDFRINALAYDEQNRLWIGTDVGVYLWNGAEMTNLGGWRGLPAEEVDAMHWYEGEMWIAYASDYLASVDGEEITLIEDEDTDFYFFAMHDMEVTDNGVVLANGSDLLSINSDGLNEATDLDSIIESLYYHEASDTLFVGTWRAGLVLQGETDQVIGPEFGIPDLYVADVVVDSLGTVWIVGDSLDISGGGGIARYIPGE